MTYWSSPSSSCWSDGKKPKSSFAPSSRAPRIATRPIGDNASTLIELDQSEEALALIDAQAEALRYRPDDVAILRWLAGESELFAVEDVHFSYRAAVAELLVERGRWEEAAAFNPRHGQLLLGQRILEDPSGARQVIDEYLAGVPDPGRGMGRVLDTLSRVGQGSLANEMALGVLEQDRSYGAIRRLMPHLMATAERADAASLAEFAIGTEGRHQGPLKGGEYRVLRRYCARASAPGPRAATAPRRSFASSRPPWQRCSPTRATTIEPSGGTPRRSGCRSARIRRHAIPTPGVGIADPSEPRGFPEGGGGVLRHGTCISTP